MPPIIDEHKCVRCGNCSEICPVDVYWGSRAKEVPVVLYGDECFLCGSCILECPTDAIKLRYPLYGQLSYLVS